MALPVMTPADLNLVQLHPKVRRALKHRADEAARRAYAPVLAADRAAFSGINRDYRTQAQSVRGATEMTQSSLAQALAGLKGSGLTGGYLRQTQDELTARMADAATAIPYLLADAQEERAGAIGEARQQLMQDRAAMLQNAAQGFNTLLKEARTAGASELEEQKDERKAAAEQAGGEGGLDISPEALRSAELEIKQALREWSQNPEYELEDGSTARAKELNPLRSTDDWDRFAKALSDQTQGASLAAIQAIIERIRPRDETARQRSEHRGVLPQPGVPGAGTWAAR